MLYVLGAVDVTGALKDDPVLLGCLHSYRLDLGTYQKTYQLIYLYVITSSLSQVPAGETLFFLVIYLASPASVTRSWIFLSMGTDPKSSLTTSMNLSPGFLHAQHSYHLGKLLGDFLVDFLMFRDEMTRFMYIN